MTKAASEALAGRLTTELRAAAQGIPGTGDYNVGVIPLSSGDAVMINTAMRGWSPVLHETRIMHKAHHRLVDDRGAPVALADFTAPHVNEMLLSLQRARAQDAARLGHQTPLPRREISHISIDRALPHIMDRPMSGMRMAVHEAVSRAHSSMLTYDGSAKFESGGVLLAEKRQDDGTWLRIALPNLKMRIDGDGKRVATLRGFDLDIEAPHLPNTVLAAMAGRMVGDVVTLHPMLDNRIITKAVNRTHKARPGIVLTIVIDVELIDIVLTEATTSTAA